MSSSIDPADQAAPADFNRLLRANLQRVFNERDPGLRAAAIAELYVADPIMYEPDAVIEGREAISAVAGKLLDQFGADFRFTPEADGIGHHHVGHCAGMRVTQAPRATDQRPRAEHHRDSQPWLLGLVRYP